MIKAPWTSEQVDALNKYQKSGRMHPFTCGSGNRSNQSHKNYAELHNDRDYGLLVATSQGWVCPVCGYEQDWAHEFMIKMGESF